MSSPVVELREFRNILHSEHLEELFKFRLCVPNIWEHERSHIDRKTMTSTTISHGVEQIKWRIEGIVYIARRGMNWVIQNTFNAPTTYVESTDAFYVENCIGQLTLLSKIPSFMSKEKMYMPDGTLILQCHLRLKYSFPELLQKNMDHVPIRSVVRSLRELQTNMRDLHDSRKDSDIVLQCGDQEFKAHRLILSTRSSVFAKMFEHDTKENRENIVVIEDTSPEAVKAMLQYLYVGELDEFSLETYLQSYALAEKYDLRVLKLLCSEFIASNLTMEHACEAAVLAHLCDDAELLSAAKRCFDSNIRAIFASTQWIVLASKYPDLAKELTK